MNSTRDASTSSRQSGGAHRFARGWFAANTMIAGALALAWLLLRTGTRPSRLAYPCQRAAMSAAMLAFGAPLMTALVAVRRRLSSGLRSPAAVTIALAGIVAGLAASGHVAPVRATAAPELLPPLDYRAQVFHASNCPQDPVGDRFPGLDAVVELMGSEGVKLHRSAMVGTTSGPDGIIGADDVVVLKINYQWSQRGGTNTDVLRGVIRLIVDHPEGFTGEIVVAENAQFASTNGFNRSQNNAQDISQSPLDVVTHFQGLGFTVSLYDWTLVRSVSVDEYSEGDMVDGYVVYPYDAQLGGRVSYPKFQTSDGTYISLRDGIWDPIGSSYDRDRLKLINMPVLKSHHSTYGVTASVKNFMGLVTGSLSTNSHSAIADGLMGAVMGEIRPPDLNILDAVWINANPYSGPSTSYGGASRRDELVVSTDSVASDRWAATNILIPAFIANGYSPPWPYPSADPDSPSSEFREYLDNSMSWMLLAGFEVTNDPLQTDVHTTDASAVTLFVDGFESGNTTAWSNTVP